MKKFFNFITNQYRKKWLLFNIAIAAIVSIFSLYYGVLTLIGLTAVIIVFVWIYSIYTLIREYYFNSDEEADDKEK